MGEKKAEKKIYIQTRLRFAVRQSYWNASGFIVSGLKSKPAIRAFISNHGVHSTSPVGL